MHHAAKLVLAAAIGILFASGGAAQSLTLDGVSPAAIEAVQGETFTADVSYTTDAGGGSISSCTLGVLDSSLPTNWDADSDTSVQTTGGSTSTVSMPQVTAGSTVETDLTVQIQCDSSSGTLSDQTTLHVTVTEPPALSGTLQSSGSLSVSSGESYTISFTVSNTGGADTQNAKAVISTPSGYSAPDSVTLTEAGQDAGVIRAGRSIGTQSFTLTADDPTDGTVTIDLTSASIGTTDSLTVDVDAPAPSGGGGGGGGGSSPSSGGGGFAPAPAGPTINVAGGVVHITGIGSSGTAAQVNLSQQAQLGIHQITVAPAGQAQVENMTLELQQLSPDTVSRQYGVTLPPRVVVDRYLSINASLPDVAATITFTVDESRLHDLGVDANAVSLYRYTDRWEQLDTSLQGRDGTRYRYTARTPGFSLFMVAAEQPRPKQEQTAGNASDTTGNQTTPPTPPGGPDTGGFPVIPLIAALIVLLAAGGAYWYWNRERLEDELRSVSEHLEADIGRYGPARQRELADTLEEAHIAFEEGREEEAELLLDRVERLMQRRPGRRRRRQR